MGEEGLESQTYVARSQASAESASLCASQRAVFSTEEHCAVLKAELREYGTAVSESEARLMASREELSSAFTATEEERSHLSASFAHVIDLGQQMQIQRGGSAVQRITELKQELAV